jgi:hypothetical protein
MSIWNKILVGLIAVASLGFFYLAARTLKTHAKWHGDAVQAEASIAQLRADNKRLMDGVEKDGKLAEPGIRQVRLELYKLLVDRRRTWFNCPAKVNNPNRVEGTAEITLTIDKPAPHGIADKTVLYAFEDADGQQKGRYLGEFVVAKVADRQVTLAPALKMIPREIDALAAAKGTWTLYEIMPQDSHEIFAARSDAEKKAILPADSVAEYLKDGQPAAKDDPKECVVDGKYVRPLRDYDVLFLADQEKRILLTDSIDAATRDKKLVQESLGLAQKQADACTRDIAAAKEELAEVTAQRKLVVDYLAKFQEALDKVRAAIKQTLQENQAKAGQIAKLQLEAAERIDRRIRAMAQSGTEKQ